MEEAAGLEIRGGGGTVCGKEGRGANLFGGTDAEGKDCSRLPPRRGANPRLRAGANTAAAELLLGLTKGRRRVTMLRGKGEREEKNHAHTAIGTGLGGFFREKVEICHLIDAWEKHKGTIKSIMMTTKKTSRRWALGASRKIQGPIVRLPKRQETSPRGPGERPRH